MKWFAMIRKSTLGRTPGLALLAVVIVLSSGQPGRSAEADRLFTVTGVAVDATAKAAAQARELAIAAGQREAYLTLLRRITLAEDYGRHPALEDAEIPALIQSFEVANEKTSSTRYLAKLTIQFKKDAIRDLLRRFAIPFSETVSRPLLVVPVFETGGAQYLWEDENPWLTAWAGREARDRLVPLLAPLGDLQDLASITVEQAVAGDDQRLAAIAERYGAAEAMVALARLRRDMSRRQIRIDVNLSRYGTAEWHAIDSVSGAEGDDVEAVLAMAVQRVADRLEDDWKRQTLLRFGDEMAISATVLIDGLENWLEVRRLLEQTAEVRRVEIATLTSVDAQVILHFLGDPDRLAVALAQRELELTEAGGFWILRLADSARRSGEQ